MREGKKY